MLTIFSTPKPFRGHIGVIQRNAIESWKRIHPDVEIILFGDEEERRRRRAKLASGMCRTWSAMSTERNIWLRFRSGPGDRAAFDSVLRQLRHRAHFRFSSGARTGGGAIRSFSDGRPPVGRRYDGTT